MSLFAQILAARGLHGAAAEEFLHPDYDAKPDPFLLSQMQTAVDRLVQAHQQRETIVIYGDYDIDGLSATALLLDAFASFGFATVQAFIPNRFVEGYGMTMGAVDKVAAMGAQLIVTVDCGSLCHEEIAYAKERYGIDTVVTDHHNIAPTRPPAIATVNMTTTTIPSVISVGQAWLSSLSRRCRRCCRVCQLATRSGCWTW